MVSGVLNNRNEWAAFMLKSGVWTNPDYKLLPHEGPNASDFPMIVTTGYDWHRGRTIIESEVSRSDFSSRPDPDSGPLAEMVAIQSDPTGKALWDTFVADPDDMSQAGVLADWCKEQGYAHVENELREAMDRGYLN